MIAIIISPRMERLRPGSWLPLPALRSAQLSTPPAAKVSKPKLACGGAEDKATARAPTQAPDIKQSKSKPVAGRYTQSSILRNTETASTHQSVSYLNAFPIGATHQCQGVLAVDFRVNRLKLLRFLALSLFD
jgi:hypothetical protein